MRIAIVNDTKMALEGLKRIISSAPEHDIAWLAEDGVEAVAQCNKDTPDLILMDLIMPNMDGVEATQKIMAQCPCAILVVTSTITGNTAQVFEAMGAGALDAVNTPVLGTDDAENGARSLLNKIHTIGALISYEIADKRFQNTTPSISTNSTLIAIGSSTGGPKALAHILSNLPADLNASIVIIQHVDETFSHGFAEWLNEQCELPVRIAKNNDPLLAGAVLIADSNKHLAVNSHGNLNYVDEPRDYPYRPSVNVFFSSIAKHWPGKAIGVLLTGMGKDGASGLLEMRTKGFPTIAQEKASCAVYGMPKAAVELNAAESVLDLNRIADHIFELATSIQTSASARHQ